tara:strand:- start:84 stop:401 length:318 start_codon:yes stop_codon:yes gene_type:complete
MITTFDVETSFQVTEEGKLDPSSKNPNNFLISMGLNDEYIFFKHREYHGTPNRKAVQDMLDKTTLLVGHNIKSDFCVTLLLIQQSFNFKLVFIPLFKRYSPTIVS